MTCIIGLVENGEVYLGADSAAVSGSEIRTSIIKKVFRRGEFLFAYTSSFRMGQLLQHQLVLDELPMNYLVTMDYMVNQFIENVRDLFKSKGYSKIENNEEYAGNFLIGVHGRLFHIWSDFQVSEFLDYTADGSGKQFALGAMEALKTVIKTPEERIIEAIKIAEKFTTTVSLPAIVVSSENLVISDLIRRP